LDDETAGQLERRADPLLEVRRGAGLAVLRLLLGSHVFGPPGDQFRSVVVLLRWIDDVRSFVSLCRIAPLKGAYTNTKDEIPRIDHIISDPERGRGFPVVLPLL